MPQFKLEVPDSKLQMSHSQCRRADSRAKVSVSGRQGEVRRDAAEKRGSVEVLKRGDQELASADGVSGTNTERGKKWNRR